MAAEVRWLCFAAVILIVTFEVLGNGPLRRFEYKYSFKPPYLAQKDGSVPFWEYGGSKFSNVTCFHVTQFCQMAGKTELWFKAILFFNDL